MSLEAAFATFPTLETPRLRLRALEPSDATAMHAIKSDAAVMPQYAQEPFATVAETAAWIERTCQAFEQHLTLLWCLEHKASSTVIGSCLLWNITPDGCCAELGYELHPAYGQQGLMSEAVRCVLHCCFTSLGLKRVEAVTLGSNTASMALLRKLGFLYEGTLRQRVHFRDHAIDHLYFGLLETDWGEQIAAS